MGASIAIIPVLALLVSFGGALALALSARADAMRNTLAVGAAALQVAVLLAMLPTVLAGETISVTLSTFLPEVSLGLRVDGLGMIFALTASVLWLVTSVYSIGYLGALDSRKQTRFHMLFALTMTATLGVAFAANLVTMYLFYEAMTLATYFLVAHDETDEAFAGARRYLAYHLGTSIAFLLPAIAITYTLSGSFYFASGGIFPAELAETSRGLMIVLFFLFIAGSAKVALMPLHGWLPAAMVAPVPVSALLHAVAVVNAGAYGVLRICFDVFGAEMMIATGLREIAILLASVTILAASLYCLRLDNLKALLAFSTIGQLAYIVLGGAMANEAGATGGMLHILNHGVSKITLFLCAGAIYVATHKKYLSEMHGLAREMPWTTLAFAIGAFSMIGFPLTAGFVSKWFLFAGAHDAGSLLALAVVILSSLLTAVYYLRALAILMGYGAPAEPGAVALPLHRGPEVAPYILWPLALTAALTVILGVFPEQTAMPLVRVFIPTSFGD